MPVITVIPASSNSGAQAVNSLLTGDFASKAKVRAAVRSAEKGAITFKDVAENPDFELISGIDASSSETLSTAFVGADYAVIVTPHDDSRGMADAAADAAMTANMINAAKEAGVKHIVYVGSWTVKAPDDIKVLSSRFVPSEALLQKLAADGGPQFTSLRSGFFYQNYYAWADAVKAGCVKWPNFSIAAVDPRDMGRVAASILASADPSVHAGKFYEISGPKVMTTKDAVDMISSKLGKDVKYEEIPYETLTFLPPFAQELFFYMGKTGESAVPFSDDTMKLCGVHTSFEAWLDEGFLKGFQG